MCFLLIVPQSSTGFSPFELLYGRTVRGPLDILRETWEATEGVDPSIREKIAQMTEIVHVPNRMLRKGGMIRQPERDVLTLKTRC